MLLGIILLLLLAIFSLICRMWVFQIIHDRPLGASGLGLHFGLEPGAWVFHWARLFFGFGE